MTFNFFSLRHIFVLLGLLVLLPAAGLAQKYRTAGGLRFSPGQYGFTVQQKVLPKTTLEGLLLAGSREVSATVLAEQHFGLLGPSLNYYLGAGAHVGNQKGNGAFGGIDAIVGIEYKVALTRFVVSADFKPSIEFNADDWARFPTAISVRYVLIKDKKQGFLNDVFGDGDDRDQRRKAKDRQKEKSRSRGGLFDF